MSHVNYYVHYVYKVEQQSGIQHINHTHYDSSFTYSLYLIYNLFYLHNQYMLYKRLVETVQRLILTDC
jgi:hypothetical protein